MQQRLTNRHGEGILTGKSLNFGGSPLRPEATGYGLIYMTKLAVEKRLGRSLEGMRCAVSGSGNVAQFASEKLLELGAKVITVSDSNGVLVFDDGMTEDDLKVVVDCKNVKRDRLRTLDGKVNGRYIEGETPWSLDIKYDLALPCATQNEIDGDGAKLLVANGVLGVLEVGGALAFVDIAVWDFFSDSSTLLYCRARICRPTWKARKLFGIIRM